MNTIFLAKNREYSTDPMETGLNNNIVVVGGSGSGKTMSIMEMKLLQNQGRSLIVNVAKKNLIQKYQTYFSQKGYEVQILDLVHPEKGTVCFDPLHYIEDPEDTVGIQNLAESIVCAHQDFRNERDPYWSISAIQLLMAEIGYILTQNRRATFLDVLNYHKDLRVEGGENILETNHDEDFNQLEPNNPAIESWLTFRQNGPTTARCIYSSLNAPLQNMFPLEIRKNLRTKPQINIQRLANKPTVLFIYTSPVNPELHALANLFMSFAVKELYEYAEQRDSGILPIPVDLLFDDFACGSPVKKFPELISIFREKGISTTIMLQSEAQLSSMYSPLEAKTILDNCDTYVYMGGMNAENAMNIAKRCNYPDERVLTLPIGKEIIIRRGEKPFLAERYDILNNPEYQKISHNK